MKLHMTGHTYNDLKPDNLMLDNDEDGYFIVTLIDYGYAKKIPETTDQLVAFFEGNLMFASAK